MEVFYKKYKLIIWLIIISIIIIPSIVFIYDFLVFRVISTSPNQNGKVNIGQSSVIFNFNKDIEEISNTNQIVSDKKIILKSRVENKKLIVYINNIEKNQNYTVTIINIRSKSGKVINNFKLSFKGEYLTVSQISPEADKVARNQTDGVSAPGSDDPVVKILPKRTSYYSLNYVLYSEPSQKGKYLKIQATLFIPDYDLNNTTLIKDYKNKALDYLKSNNINPNNYVIDWNPKSAANL